MTQLKEDTIIRTVFEIVNSNGMEGLGEAISILINEAMKAERSSVLKKLCGLEISSVQVSNASKMLDDELDKWRNRPIGRIQFLQLDARYEKVRQDGMVLSCAVLVDISGLFGLFVPYFQPNLTQVCLWH